MELLETTEMDDETSFSVVESKVVGVMVVMIMMKRVVAVRRRPTLV